MVIRMTAMYSQFSLQAAAPKAQAPPQGLSLIVGDYLGQGMVRKGGLEPPCLSAPPPQDGVSANFTTSAHTRPDAASITASKQKRRGSASIAKQREHRRGRFLVADARGSR